MKLNKRFIRATITALESGKFTHTKGRLKRVRAGTGSGQNPGHCCLGVMCEIAPRFKSLPRVRWSLSRMRTLPHALRTAIGLSLADHNELCRRNDRRFATDGYAAPIAYLRLLLERAA